jgi:putative flippase GtrA
MALIAEGLRFALVGVALIAADAGLFILLSAAGLHPHPANLLARLGGAALGFLLHGGFTFAAADGAWPRRPALLRYALLWLALTALSTLSLGAIAAAFGLRAAWAAKAPLEALLAVASFFLMRLWVFRR